MTVACGPAGGRGAGSGALRSRGAPRCGVRSSSRTRSADAATEGWSAGRQRGRSRIRRDLVSCTLEVLKPQNGQRVRELVALTKTTRQSGSSTPTSSTAIPRRCRRIVILSVATKPSLEVSSQHRGWRGSVARRGMVRRSRRGSSRAQFPRFRAISGLRARWRFPERRGGSRRWGGRRRGNLRR